MKPNILLFSSKSCRPSLIFSSFKTAQPLTGSKKSHDIIAPVWATLLWRLVNIELNLNLLTVAPSYITNLLIPHKLDR